MQFKFYFTFNIITLYYTKVCAYFNDYPSLLFQMTIKCCCKIIIIIIFLLISISNACSTQNHSYKLVVFMEHHKLSLKQIKNEFKAQEIEE